MKYKTHSKVILLIIFVLTHKSTKAEVIVKFPKSLFTMQGTASFQNSPQISNNPSPAQFERKISIAPILSFNFSYLILPEKHIYATLGLGHRSTPMKYELNTNIIRGSEIWNSNSDFYEQAYPNGAAPATIKEFDWRYGDNQFFRTYLGLNKLFPFKSNSDLCLNLGLGLATLWKFDKSIELYSGFGYVNPQTSESIKFLEVEVGDNRGKLLYHNFNSKLGLTKFGERKVYHINFVFNLGLTHLAVGEYKVLNNGAEESGNLKMNMNYLGLEIGYGWQL
jgi:hypothetical protein